MQRLGLLAGQDRLLGGRNRRLELAFRMRASLLVLATAGEPDPGATSCAQRDAVEPVAQQVGIADRARLPSQDQEDGLEGVFGVVAVAQELTADTEHHRAVPRHQGREGRLAGVALRGEPLQELPVGKAGDRAAVEERPDLPDHRP